MLTHFRFVHKRSGQAMILFALLFTIICGFAALTVDFGMVTLNKSKLQTAADSSALAGALDLPNASTARSTAISIASQNGVEASNITPTTPFGGDSKKIEVVCKATVHFSFARVLGFTQTEVTARAVARNVSQWAGEALPFINLDDDYGTDPEIVAWEKTSSGDFESINNYEIINPNDHDKLYFSIDYLNGIVLKKGTVATIKQEVGYVFDQKQPDKPVYIISLNRTVMNSGTVKLKDGTNRSLSKLKNGDIVDPSQLVLLECLFHDYDYQGKTLFLTVLHVFDIAHNSFPPDYVNPDGGSSKLVE